MGFALAHIFLYIAILAVCVRPLGWYIAQVMQGYPCVLNVWLRPIERGIARCCGISLEEEMDWKQYLTTLLLVNLCGMLIVYLLQRIQYYLPFNPQNFSGVAPDLAFNTAASFVTNTNWQAYSGENTMSYATQMLALVVQQFLSAGTGIAVMVAFVRSLVRQETSNLGNFWQDIIRSVLYILLPMALLFAVLLVSQGVIQNFKSYVDVQLLEPTSVQTVKIPMGPVAAMVSIKQLGTNGGGFFNTNSAHPFENPNLITNYLEMLALVLIPAALTYTFGMMINDKRQGWALLAVMFFIFIPMALISINVEQLGNPLINELDVINLGNMEGKEVRFGPVYSALWGAATTSTANGSINYMHDSAMPISGFIYLLFMQIGEIIFGGAGCGMYGMLLTVIITVFIAGLMIGRTSEYLGKKIEPYEMKMVSLVVIVLPLLVLICSAIACVSSTGLSSLNNPGAHGLSEIIYAFTSMRSNNGSAFAGLNANTLFYNVLGGIMMLIGRFWLIIGLLAVAGALVKKKIVPVTSGTLATHDLSFLIFLIGIIIIICTLSFLPVLAIGPLAEHFTLWSSK